MNKIYSDYALLDAQIQELTAKKESMRVDIIKTIIEENNGETVESPFGKFTLAKVKSWTFPVSVIALQEKVAKKIAKLKDEAKSSEELAKSTGEATCTETDSLRFISVKL